jgi:hypothetical protein
LSPSTRWEQLGFTPSALSGPGVSGPTASTAAFAAPVSAKTSSNVRARASIAISGPPERGWGIRQAVYEEPTRGFQYRRVVHLPPLSRPTTTRLVDVRIFSSCPATVSNACCRRLFMWPSQPSATTVLRHTGRLHTDETDIRLQTTLSGVIGRQCEEDGSHSCAAHIRTTDSIPFRQGELTGHSADRR